MGDAPWYQRGSKEVPFPPSSTRLKGREPVAKKNDEQGDYEKVRDRQPARTNPVAAARSTAVPETMFEAMMEAAPFEGERLSIEEFEPIREAIGRAVESLDQELQWVIEAMFWRGLSTRDLEHELPVSKSTVHRWKHKALVQLREALSEQPEIRDYLGGDV